MHGGTSGPALRLFGLAGVAFVGYHRLAVGRASHEEAPERLTKGLARQPVSIMLLARHAVDRRRQDRVLGTLF